MRSFDNDKQFEKPGRRLWEIAGHILENMARIQGSGGSDPLRDAVAVVRRRIFVDQSHFFLSIVQIY